MARFYATIQGGRGAANRAGHASKGIAGHIRGWHSGVEIIGDVQPGDCDRFSVYMTGGSSGTGRRLIGHVVQSSHGPVWVPRDTKEAPLYPFHPKRRNYAADGVGR
jgi:hypothetical protein